MKSLEQRRAEVMRRSTKGAIHVPSAEGRGVVSPSGDARRLAQEACARALSVQLDREEMEP